MRLSGKPSQNVISLKAFDPRWIGRWVIQLGSCGSRSSVYRPSHSFSVTVTVRQQPEQSPKPFFPHHPARSLTFPSFSIFPDRQTDASFVLRSMHCYSVRSPPHWEIPFVTSSKKKEVKIDRRTSDSDRRQNDVPVARERRKVQRRRQIDPTTCERDYTEEEIEFMHALDAYKRANGRMFPTCSEILEVVRSMGYVRISSEPCIECEACPTATDERESLEDEPTQESSDLVNAS
jgi:ferredoxin-like protein FixX